jgi:hypothetical protein
VLRDAGGSSTGLPLRMRVVGAATEPRVRYILGAPQG